MNPDHAEKADAMFDIKHDEAIRGTPSNGNDSDIIEYPHQEEKRLIRKVDWRLLPILGALYAISLIDRVNVGSPSSP
jgi:hypothetical protein